MKKRNRKVSLSVYFAFTLGMSSENIHIFVPVFLIEISLKKFSNVKTLSVLFSFLGEAPAFT